MKSHVTHSIAVRVLKLVLAWAEERDYVDIACLVGASIRSIEAHAKTVCPLCGHYAHDGANCVAHSACRCDGHGIAR